MKFSVAALVGFAGVAQAAIRNNERNLGPGDGPSSGSSSGDYCDNCGYRLPGYVYWGEQYLEEDFYIKAVNCIFDEDCTLSSDSSDELEVFAPFSICTSFFVPPASPGFQWEGPVSCLVLTIISELIFQSDLLSCLLISFDKTTKDTLCFIADIIGVPNPDQLGDPNPLRKLNEPQQGGGNSWVTFVANVLGDDGERKLQEDEGRKLQADPGSCLTEGIPSEAFILCMLGIGNEQIANFAENAGIGAQFGQAIAQMASTRRELTTDIRPSNDEIGSGGIIQEVADFIDDLAWNEETFQFNNWRLANGFFIKCIRELPPFPCLLIYTLEKTIDAIICQKLQDCDIDEVCDGNQNFLTEYTSRRLARDIPTFFDFTTEDANGIFNFLVADIIAPCIGCEDQCADLCWYVDNFDQCDSYKRWFLTPAGINLTEFRYLAVPLGWLIIILSGGFPILGPIL